MIEPIPNCTHLTKYGKLRWELFIFSFSNRLGSFAHESADLACITQTMKRTDIEFRACFIMLVLVDVDEVSKNTKRVISMSQSLFQHN
jgi:hypothetical protein